MTTEKNSNKTRTRLILGLLMLIFAAPFGAAWFIYNFTDLGKGDQGNNFGELVKPSVNIPDLILTDLVSGEHTFRLHGKWSVVYNVGKDCGLDCKRSLDMILGLKSAFEKDAGRIQSMVAVSDTTLLIELKQYLAQQKGQHLLLFPGSSQVGSDNTDATPMSADVLGANKIYIIDPLGNLMMSYDAGSKPEGIISDLKRLLRYSRIG